MGLSLCCIFSQQTRYANMVRRIITGARSCEHMNYEVTYLISDLQDT